MTNPLLKALKFCVQAIRTAGLDTVPGGICAQASAEARAAIEALKPDDPTTLSLLGQWESIASHTDLRLAIRDRLRHHELASFDALCEQTKIVARAAKDGVKEVAENDDPNDNEPASDGTEHCEVCDMTHAIEPRECQS